VQAIVVLPARIAIGRALLGVVAEEVCDRSLSERGFVRLNSGRRGGSPSQTQPANDRRIEGARAARAI